MELFGDSARGPEWAAVRLRVDGDRIVDADADGLAQDLRGLTLLEAAAVGGETLPVDALANALAPAVRAAADPERVAVAMSGGVDSAVTLLRSGPSAVGVTLRLWLDPDGPDSERACCSPSAVIAARTLCHSRGLPHVTLDLREEFRRAVVGPFVRGYARGETPNPCIRCNGGFRFAELLAFARRIGAARLATGHYARIVERDGLTLLARAADPAKDQSYMLARLDPRRLARVVVPARHADEDGDARRGGRGRARRRRPRREPGGVLPRGRRLPVVPRAARPRSRAGCARRRGGRRGRRRTTATGGSHPGSAAGSASPLASRSTPLETHARTNTVVVGPREALARRTVTVRGRLFAPATNVEAKLRYRSPAVARERRADGDRLPPPPRRARVRRRAWPGGGSVRRRRGRRFRFGHVRERRLV